MCIMPSVVKSLDDAVAGAEDADAALAVYADGVARLNEAAGGSFADLDDDAKEAALQAEAERRRPRLLPGGARPGRERPLQRSRSLEDFRLSGRFLRGRRLSCSAASTISPGCRLRPPRRARRHKTRKGRGRTWQRQYELNDDGVVVIIGSGAGGGSLGHELCNPRHRRGDAGGGGSAEHRDTIRQ